MAQEETEAYTQHRENKKQRIAEESYQHPPRALGRCTECMSELHDKWNVWLDQGTIMCLLAIAGLLYILYILSQVVLQCVQRRLGGDRKGSNS